MKPSPEAVFVNPQMQFLKHNHVTNWKRVLYENSHEKRKQSLVIYLYCTKQILFRNFKSFAGGWEWVHCMGWSDFYQSNVTELYPWRLNATQS